MLRCAVRAMQALDFLFVVSGIFTTCFLLTYASVLRYEDNVKSSVLIVWQIRMRIVYPTQLRRHIADRFSQMCSYLYPYDSGT